MGLSDNLFHRKAPGKTTGPPKPAGGISQQFRLTNLRKSESVTGSQSTTSSYQRPRRFGLNAGPKNENSLKKGEYAIRFVVHEQNEHGLTLVPSSINCSLPDLSSVSSYERSSNNPQCICYRSACYIACDEFNCHYVGFGRVSRRCPCHPTTTYLLDLTRCPKCLGTIREHPDRIIANNLDDDDDEDL